MLYFLQGIMQTSPMSLGNEISCLTSGTHVGDPSLPLEALLPLATMGI